MRFLIPLLLLLATIGCQNQTKDKVGPAGEQKASTNQAESDRGRDARLAESSEEVAKKSVRVEAGKNELRILHWNIESGGSDPNVIADQLQEFAVQGGYQIFALSEVHHDEVYRKKFESMSEDDRWKTLLAKSGGNDQREDDRLMILFDSQRLKLIQSQELTKYGDYNLNTGRHRSPMVAMFECRESGEVFMLLHNHLARGNAEFRAEQAAGLREFARENSVAKIAVGDYNFDYVFETKIGNEGFVEFMRDGVWKWIEPEKLIDTNWFDPEPDGVDNYPGSMLDFTFVAGKARDWDVTSKVIVREGDFPDDEKTSDHRPVEVIVKF